MNHRIPIFIVGLAFLLMGAVAAFGGSAGYPTGVTPVAASVTGTTAATTVTLPAAVGMTTYICGFSIRASATAATSGNATVTGTVSATMNFLQSVTVTAADAGKTEITFYPCLTASAANTAIAVNSIAAGAGGVVSVSAWGFQN